MALTGLSPSIATETTESRSPKKLLLFFLFLAAMFHLLVFLQKFSGLLAPIPPRVELQNIDSHQLDAIKRQWREKSLLLNPNANPKTDTRAPEDARYFSDHNIRVEKEQRARDTSPIVKPKAAQSSPASPPNRSAAKSKGPPQPKVLPDLKMLGIHLPAPNRQLANQNNQDQTQNTPASHRSEEGGAQYIQDKNLPQGTENLLNAQESVFYSFYARIYEAIGPVWQSRIRQISHPPMLQDGDYSTLVDVVLDASGNLIHVHLLQTSGVQEFDETVDASWKKLDKFPNPPQGLLNLDRQIHMGWTFTVHVAKGLSFESPSRSY